MTKQEREKQLVSARQACLLLAPFAVGSPKMAVLTDEARECVADLLEQFGRLDKAERKEINSGKKGGRPKNPLVEQLSPRQQARRRKQGAE